MVWGGAVRRGCCVEVSSWEMRATALWTHLGAAFLPEVAPGSGPELALTWTGTKGSPLPLIVAGMSVPCGWTLWTHLSPRAQIPLAGPSSVQGAGCGEQGGAPEAGAAGDTLCFQGLSWGCSSQKPKMEWGLLFEQ